MGLAAKIYEEADGKLTGRQVSDQPDGFLRMAVLHAQRSPGRFPQLSRVSLEGNTAFGPDLRDALKAEWLLLDSLAVGRTEKNKWDVVFQALLHADSFRGVQFVSN